MKRATLHGLALTVIAVLAITASALAEDGEKKGDKSADGKAKDKAELVELSLTGTVAVQQGEKKGNDGNTYSYTAYYLETDDGKIFLPPAKAEKKGGTAPFNLADFVGAKVKIDAVGSTADGKKGGKRTYVHRITNISRLET